MFYKVIKDNKVIDVLDKLIFLKWHAKHKTMILCKEDDAQAILSSNKRTIWHEKSLYKIPADGFDEVEIEEISEHEYNRLKILHCMSIEEILDAYTISLIQEGII